MSGGGTEEVLAIMRMVGLALAAVLCGILSAAAFIAYLAEPEPYREPQDFALVVLSFFFGVLAIAFGASALMAKSGPKSPR